MESCFCKQLNFTERDINNEFITYKESIKTYSLDQTYPPSESKISENINGDYEEFIELIEKDIDFYKNDIDQTKKLRDETLRKTKEKLSIQKKILETAKKRLKILKGGTAKNEPPNDY